MTARGTFDIATEAEPPFLERDGNKLNYNVVRKDFAGGMVGSSEARMITAFTNTQGSAGYVAIEHFSGSIDGRSGSCVFQHSGVMAEGAAELSVVIVPGSGTAELSGISGAMEIDNADGKHTYVLDYELGD